jgi:hypothetical protein
MIYLVTIIKPVFSSSSLQDINNIRRHTAVLLTMHGALQSVLRRIVIDATDYNDKAKGSVAASGSDAFGDRETTASRSNIGSSNVTAAALEPTFIALLQDAALVLLHDAHTAIHVYTLLLATHATNPPPRSSNGSNDDAISGVLLPRLCSAVIATITSAMQLSQRLAVCSCDPRKSPSEASPPGPSQVFAPHYPTLVTLLRSVFQKVLPHLLLRVNETRRRRESVHRDELLVAGTIIAFIRNSLRLIASVATMNPLAFMQNWPLFLSDSLAVESTLPKRLGGILDSVSINRPLSENTELQTQVKDMVGRLQSPVYSLLFVDVFHSNSKPLENDGFNTLHVLFSLDISEIRSSASEALTAFVKDVQLRKWFVLQASSDSKGGSSNNSQGTGVASSSTRAGNSAATNDTLATSSTARSKILTNKSITLGVKLRSNAGIGTAAVHSQQQKTSSSVIKMLNMIALSILLEDDHACISSIISSVKSIITILPLATLYSLDGKILEGKPVVSSELEEAVAFVFRALLVAAFDNPLVLNCFPTKSSSVQNAFTNSCVLLPQHRSLIAIDFLNTLAHCFDGPLSSFSSIFQKIAIHSSYPTLWVCNSVVETRVVTFSDVALYLAYSLSNNISLKTVKDARGTYVNAVKSLMLGALQTVSSSFIDVQYSSVFKVFFELSKANQLAPVRGILYQIIGLVLKSCLITSVDSPPGNELNALVSPTLVPDPYECTGLSQKSVCDSDSLQHFSWDLFSGLVRSASASRNDLNNPSGLSPVAQSISIDVFYDLFCCLQAGLSDADHLARGHALGSVGLMNVRCWMGAGLSKPVSLTTTSAHNASLVASTLSRLIAACSDSVGTVRAVAIKSLGEAVCEGCLQSLGGELVSLIEDMTRGRSVGNDWVTSILVAMQQCCADSKLAVRMQAVWSLGNFLLLLLPNRLLSVDRLRRSSDIFRSQISLTAIDLIPESVISSSNWTHERNWSDLANLCVHILKSDSDKVVTSTSRCIGIIAAGVVHRNDIFAALFNVLIAKILLRKEVDLDRISHIIVKEVSDGDITIMKISSLEIADAVLNHPQKLLMSLCSSLGMIAWSIGVIISDNATELPIHDVAKDALCAILDVFIEFIRHGSAKLRAMTCKALLLLCYFPLNSSQPVHNLTGIYLSDGIFGTERTQRLMDAILAELSKLNARALSIELAQRKASKSLSNVSSFHEKMVVTSAVSRGWRGRVHFQGGLIVAESDDPSSSLSRGGPLVSPLMSLKSLQKSERRLRTRGVPGGAAVSTGALHSAISLRHRPMKGGADDLMLLRLYIIVIWMMTVNRSNSRFVGDSDTGRMRNSSIDCLKFDSVKLDCLVSRLEVAIDDTELLEDNLLALLSSPVICLASVSRQRLFKGYRNAANTLAADISKYLLSKQSISTTIPELSVTQAGTEHLYSDAMLDRLAWLAAADIKYFILPDKTHISTGTSAGGVSASPQADIASDPCAINASNASARISLLHEFGLPHVTNQSVASAVGGVNVIIQGADEEEEEDEI